MLSNLQLEAIARFCNSGIFATEEFYDPFFQNFTECIGKILEFEPTNKTDEVYIALIMIGNLTELRSNFYNIVSSQDIVHALVFEQSSDLIITALAKTLYRMAAKTSPYKNFLQMQIDYIQKHETLNVKEVYITWHKSLNTTDDEIEHLLKQHNL